MYYAVLWLVWNVIEIYVWAVIVYTLLLMGISFNIVNPRNEFVRKVIDALSRAIEPVLRPIRRAVPPLGSVDISPMILLLLLKFLERIILYS